MKKFCTLLLLLTLPFILFGQDKKEAEKSIQLYGFIRNAVYTDTYRGIDVTHDQFYLLPLYGDVDANGDDINQDFQSNMTAVASRLGVKINGPEIFNAKSSALMEFDFSGITKEYPSLFRIRQAYMKLEWEKSALIAGQTWHPFWGDAAFPHVGSLNTGAPFQPFNRSPQARFDYRISDNFTVLGAAVFENQYVSKGFYTISDDVDKTKPSRYSGIPEIVAMAKYKAKNLSIGIGAEYKSILPIDIINDIKTDITNNSYGFTAYSNYKKNKLYILLKGTYGQNLTHLTMPGGYGVKKINSNGTYEYTNYNHYTAFANITYGDQWLVGFIAGYGKNLGTNHALTPVDGNPKIVGTFTSQSLMLHSMYRIAPQVSYNIKNFQITAEYEMTSANYGSGTFNYADGLYSDTVNATNHRILLMMIYKF